jgi:sigma-54 interacting transcriptional regulator
VLQTGVFERLGSTKSVRVKVRVIAVTNQPLERLVNERRFRADLFYRLNILPITLPPLRERSADIPLLIKHFIDKYSARFKRSIISISEQSLHALEQYHWPGNVRELENLVERAVLSAGGAILKVAPPAIRVEPAISISGKLSETVTATLATCHDYWRHIAIFGEFSPPVSAPSTPRFGKQEILIFCNVNELPRQRPALTNRGKAIAKHTTACSYAGEIQHFPTSGETLLKY